MPQAESTVRSILYQEDPQRNPSRITYGRLGWARGTIGWTHSQ